jgi:hypothetical protein
LTITDGRYIGMLPLKDPMPFDESAGFWYFRTIGSYNKYRHFFATKENTRKMEDL